MRFSDVGSLELRDIHFPPPRKMSHYTPAWTFACQLIENLHPGIGDGDVLVRCFLLPTALWAESGLRVILRRTLRGKGVAVSKIVIPATDEFGGHPTTFNPDLVFKRDGAIIATGDVKYEVVEDDTKPWNPRPDLNQALGFTVAANVKHAIIARFARGAPRQTPRMLVIGEVRVHFLLWPMEEPDPKKACEFFEAQARTLF